MHAELAFAFIRALVRATAPTGSRFVFVMLFAIQLTGVSWCFFLRTANDRIDGIEKTIAFVMEAIAKVLLLFSSALSDLGDLAQLTLAIDLAVLAADLLKWAIFVPLGVTICIVAGP